MTALPSQMSPTHSPVSSSDEMSQAYQKFREEFPEYENTRILDDLRAKEYSRLDRQGQVYLDYTGAGLYSDHQLEEHVTLLRTGIFGNPHSTNPSSRASTQLAEQARSYVLEYFNASPDEYVVVFTKNASGALKLIGESYPFENDSRYLLTFDNHNAVNGIREFARSKGAVITYVPVVAPDLRIDGDRLLKDLETTKRYRNNLFVFPAQSNFSGVQHSLEWISRAHANSWDVILDAAAFAPTNLLDVNRYRPDFVPLSFYKMFGYPTGVGCLIAKKTALKKLRRPWFSGGTIEMASVQGDRHFLSEGATAFEDGTIDYLNLPAIEIGLRHLQKIGTELIHTRVTTLTAWLLKCLTSLSHSNGSPLVEIYGPRDIAQRGASVAMNFLDPAGTVFNFRFVEEAAAKFNISLRTGCFCNPGAGEIAFGLTKKDMVDCFGNEERASFEQCILAVKGKTAGAVRVSLGIATNFDDVYRFLRFVRSFIDTSSGSK
ncbi:MAG: aminotransferase class V-fold PLP-dependent enzyme [Bacteroidota bacterium]|jgi:selenocysteine lyase/cysteine desulfurase